MKKVILILVIFAFYYSVPVYLVKAEEVSKPAKPNSYELFWPLSPGKVSGEPFYSLKLAKENFRGVFVFSDLKRAEYEIMLSDKRVLEAEKLFLEKDDKINGRKTLESAQGLRDAAIEKYRKTKKENKNTTQLKIIIGSSLSRQKTVLTYMASIISEDQKKYFKEVINHLDSSFSSL